MKTFNVPPTYRSPLIASIKQQRKADDKLKKDFSPTLIDLGAVRFYLARHFGFCYGVENAIEIAFRTVEENPGKRIFLLSEMIHNPFVNQDLNALGVKFLMDTYGNELVPLDEITKEDIVLIPAFGTTIPMEDRLKALGIPIEKYNTTCPFVEKVWNRSEQIAQKGYSIVIHGKPTHEETRATFSHSSAGAPSVIVNDMKETIELAKYITGEKSPDQFYQEFAGRYSEGYDIAVHLQRLGVVNQTTMLASDTQAIADYLKNAIKKHFDLSDTRIGERFADTRDTLCYATNDNQTAVSGMLKQEADLAIVIGGRNSSNTSHLVELCETHLPTYFVRSAGDIFSKNEILHGNWRTGEETIINHWLPDKRTVRILVTSGASCPDSMVEGVLKKIHGFFEDALPFDTTP
jgi:4-hydroxy-3-methylbut-2-en-1-yl diphosphate reductase